MGKTIVVAGCGIGGIVAANELRKKLGDKARIIVIDKSPKHVFYPSLLWVMIGLRAPEKIQKGLSFLSAKGMEFVNSEITGISAEKRRVSCGKKTFTYDYLIVSLGAALSPESVEGLMEGGYNLYDVNGVVRLGKAVKAFSGGKIAILIARLPFKCPAAPYETAFLLDSYFRRKGARRMIEIEVYTPESLPMPVAGLETGEAVKEMLESRNIKFSPESAVVSINAKKKLMQFGNGKSAKFGLLIFVPPHTAPKVIRDSALSGESGWIPVDAATLKTKFENVYAIGDVASVKLPDGKMLPKAGVFAHAQAEVVAHNIAAEILGRGSMKMRTFGGNGYCFLETGDGKAAFSHGNFYSVPRSIRLKKAGRLWHWGKVLLEKYWFWKWFK
ncbi:NAD(P)/FAD-dependent oxidoreductase [Candidatus Woesearchaeota archaeon]|nr:NAD(P)/FAD-dependent oxidoreductase [Candidatus Woesearchaeota archaeon]